MPLHLGTWTCWATEQGGYAAEGAADAFLKHRQRNRWATAVTQSGLLNKSLPMKLQMAESRFCSLALDPKVSTVCILGALLATKFGSRLPAARPSTSHQQ